jgi:glycosyltransferase involved in cell wall biosynthesis
MKIALLPSADLAYNSGSVIHAKRWLRYLRSHGHEVHVLASRAPHDLDDELLRSVHVVPDLLEHPVIVDRPVSDRAWIASLTGSIAFLDRIAADGPIDVVHAQYASFTSHAAAVFGAITGTPFVVSSFGRDLAAVRAGHGPLRRMALASLPAAAAIVTAHADTTAGVRDLLGDARVPILEIPAPVDVEPILRAGTAPAAATDEPPLVACISSCFAPDKGIDVLLEAIALVRAPLRVRIAGADDHPDQLHRRRLEATVERLRLADVVRFVGYLPRDAVGRLLATAAVLVDPRHSTNFSSVSVEAQFASCPLVAADTRGSREIVEHGANGWLFRPGDPHELAAAIAGALEPEHQRRLRAGARTWRHTHGQRYREDTCHARLLALCADVARRRTS